ncbi:MAG: hypothetical protein ABW061_00815 [Polyangiaceae bacterium]
MANETATQTSVPVAGASAQSVNGGPAPSKDLLYREAYEQVLAASQALSPDELVQINIDVPSAVTRSTGVIPKIMALRDQVRKELPEFDISHFDQLQMHTFATAHAHAAFLAASAPPEELVALNERGTKLRDTLYTDALALSNRGIISGDRIAAFKANNGYKNIAFDLLGLASLLRQNWDKISGKTALELSELDEAERVGKQLVGAVAVRENSPAVIAAVQAQRERNFTLFTRSYDQVRRALSYLRWNDDDVDLVAPSLYKGRGGRGKDTTEPDPDPDAPTAPTGTPTAPAGTPTPAGASGAGPAAPANPVAATGVGMPNSNPFAGI